MKSIAKSILSLILIAVMVLTAGCSSGFAGEGHYIITTKELKDYINKQGVVIVDMQKPEEYAIGHLTGAVNIPLSDIVINTPVPNMLASKEQIEKVLGSKGISNDTAILIYDHNNNMEAARLWWTLQVYGHDNAKVISGGLEAVQAAKMEMSTKTPSVAVVTYTAKDKNTDIIATFEDVQAQVNQPDKDTILLDTRSQEEYDQGTIPSSILINYISNNYNDGTYKSVQDIRIQYLESKIKAENTVIMYCKTSVRAAQTYLALYNAGYRNLKVYDGAWLEWSVKGGSTAQPETPAAAPVESNSKDNS